MCRVQRQGLETRRSNPRLNTWQVSSSSRKRKLQFVKENGTDREGGDE